ncbi:MAG: SRPBCC family protein [Leptospira sp.]|nr:SRPBCC family protein [Leptospira sp.]
MPRTLKISFGISLILLCLVATFLGIGFVQEVEYKHSISGSLNVPRAEIWTFLVDFKDIPNRRKDVIQVEIMELDPATSIPIKWKELTEMGGYMTFQRGETIPNQKLEVQLIDSSYKIRGKWTYELSEQHGITTITVTERSEIKSPLIRGAYFLAGRDSTLQQELAMIQNHFKAGR